MSIDASALNAIHNAIQSSSPYPGKTKFEVNNGNDDLHSASGIAKAASQITYTSRYQARFQEKLNKANASEDNVTISEESLAKLAAYNKFGKSTATVNKDGEKDHQTQTDNTTSNKTVYSYDYQSIKKKRLENLAAMEKEIAAKYGKKEEPEKAESVPAANTQSQAVKSEENETDQKAVSSASDAPKVNIEETAKTDESTVTGTQKQTAEVDA